MDKSNFELMNIYGTERVPFVFFIDFKKDTVILHKIKELENSTSIFYHFNGITNVKNKPKKIQNPSLSFSKIDKSAYNQKFNAVKKHLQHGDTYLLNLTSKSNINCNLTLKEIFEQANAKFKAYYKDEFVFFSPEKFVTITHNTIATFPMKGTIDASIPNAKEKILADEKEMAEHNTIIDLLRNDLSIVGKNTRVKHYRYIDEINTINGKLLQVSSAIEADLEANWQNTIGDILNKLTPAGSICGAPKQKTCELIDAVEGYNRGFYTGVCGIFTGDELHSGVMIRFIENTKNGLVFKSGGGIHHLSKLDEEYEELMQKIYLPF